MAQRDRYRVLREPMDEVGRAVERVDNPGVLRVAAGSRFLGQHGVVRGVAASVHRRSPLGGMIHFSDEIERPRADADIVEVHAGAVDDRTGLRAALTAVLSIGCMMDGSRRQHRGRV